MRSSHMGWTAGPVEDGDSWSDSFLDQWFKSRLEV